MAYRITYENKTIKKDLCNVKYKVNIKRICSILTVTIMLITFFHSKVRRFLLPGDPEVTERALNNMVTNIKNGEQFVDALTDFCEEILDNA